MLPSSCTANASENMSSRCAICSIDVDHYVHGGQKPIDMFHGLAFSINTIDYIISSSTDANTCNNESFEVLFLLYGL